jgi:hypothetical protein
MTRSNGNREQVKNTQKKEEKMNARKVVSVVCVLVVGLVLVLESTALAEPPRLEPRLGVIPIYSGPGYDPVPRVIVPLYRLSDCKLPSFYRGWTSTSGTVSVQADCPTWYDLLEGRGLPNNIAPPVRVPQYRQNGPRSPWR